MLVFGKVLFSGHSVIKRLKVSLALPGCNQQLNCSFGVPTSANLMLFAIYFSMIEIHFYHTLNFHPRDFVSIV